MAEVFPARKRKFFVPFIAEPSPQRTFEEFKSPDTLCPSEDLGRLADFPTVEIDRCHMRIILYPDRVEVARHRFVEGNPALPECPLDSAGITFEAACPFACVEVAAEESFCEVETH